MRLLGFSGLWGLPCGSIAALLSQQLMLLRVLARSMALTPAPACVYVMDRDAMGTRYPDTKPSCGRGAARAYLQKPASHRHLCLKSLPGWQRAIASLTYFACDAQRVEQAALHSREAAAEASAQAARADAAEERAAAEGAAAAELGARLAAQRLGFQAALAAARREAGAQRRLRGEQLAAAEARWASAACARTASIIPAPPWYRRNCPDSRQLFLRDQE